MDRGGRRAGSGVKKGDKRGPYTKSAATKKRSEPSDASTAMLAAFIAHGKNNDAPQDGPDDGPPTAAAPAHVLAADDKSKTRANDGGANWQLAADARGSFPLDHNHNMAGA